MVVFAPYSSPFGPSSSGIVQVCRPNSLLPSLLQYILDKHPFVGQVELRKIAVGKTELNKQEQKNIPIREIVSTASVWAVWIAAIGNFVCVNMVSQSVSECQSSRQNAHFPQKQMFLYSPTYLNTVLKFPVAHTGFSASLAPLAQFGIKLFAGFTSDKVI
jgi:hypothetical protein